jgi:hypothetical protein
MNSSELIVGVKGVLCKEWPGKSGLMVKRYHNPQPPIFKISQIIQRVEVARGFCCCSAAFTLWSGTDELRADDSRHTACPDKKATAKGIFAAAHSQGW